jgi:crossover junction endodeoxyribonuclease RuvC
MIRILGIDPGLRTTGFGVIECEGAKLHYVASGTISTTHLAVGDLPGRIKVLFEGVREVVQRYQPQQAALEIVFVNVSPQSSLLLGQARGAALAALVSSDLPVAEYTALQNKCRRWSPACSRCLACRAGTPPTPWAWPSCTPTPGTRWPRLRRPRHWRADNTPNSAAVVHTDVQSPSSLRSHG